MPKLRIRDITVNYDQQGAGEPLVLIPYLAADYACYAFQVAEYSKHFTCVTVDLRGAGDTDKPGGSYSTEQFADDIAAFMGAARIDRAHIAGLSLGAATGMWLAAKYPAKVKSLALHSGWAKSDAFLKTVVEGWQVMASALQRAGDDHQGHLSVVLYARTLWRPAGLHQFTGRLREGPTGAAAGRLSPPVRCGDRA